MTTKVLNDVATGIDGRIDIKALDGTSRTAGKAEGRGEHNSRTIIMLGQTTGNDADDALMPGGIIDKNGLLVLDVHLVNHLDSLFGDALVELLAVLVVLRNAFGTGLGRLGIACDEQIDGFLAIHHTARSVDAGTDLEDDVRIGELLLVLQTALLDDCLQAVAWIVVQAPKAIVGKDTVFAGDGDNIRGDTDGAEVQQGVEHSQLIHAIVASKGLHELKAYATCREMRVGIFVVNAFGIEYGNSFRQLIIGLVVVADDEVNAFLLGIAYHIDCLDAAIERNDQFNAYAIGVINTLLRNTISIVITVGDIVIQRGIETAQEAIDQRHGTGAIDIIVSVDENMFLATYGFIQAGYSLVHILHQERVV